jgi:excisionase family DNA binding protein
MTVTVEQLQREWLSYIEAQTVSGLGRTTLWKLVRSGEIQAAKVGKAVRISRRSLSEYMERQAYADGQRHRLREFHKLSSRRRGTRPDCPLYAGHS